VLTDGKPIQRARFGECSEGLPGSTKDAGHGARIRVRGKHQGIGRPWLLLRWYMGHIRSGDR